MAKGSAGIRVGISMEGVQEFASQADRAAAKTEQLQKRSEKAIGGVMSALQRQFDRLTKSQEQIGLEKLQKAGASQEVVAKYQEQWSAINRLMEAEKAAEAQKVQAEAAERARIERIKQAQIAAAQQTKDRQLKIERSLKMERQRMDADYERSLQYAQGLGRGPMFGKTLGPLARGFAGFKAVDLGLSAVSNGLSQLASGGQIDAMKLYSDTVINFVNSLPGGERLVSIAESIHKLYSGGPSASEIEAKAEAMAKVNQVRMDAAGKAYARIEHLKAQRERAGKSDSEIARLDRADQLEKAKSEMVAGGMNPEVALARIREMKALMEEIDKRRASPSAAMQAEEFGRLMQEQKDTLAQITESEQELYRQRINRLFNERKITAEQADQLNAEYKKVEAARQAREQQERLAEQRRRDEQEAQRAAEEAKRKSDAAAEAAAREQEMLANRRASILESAMSASQTESVGTAIGGVKIAGMQERNSERIISIQEAMKAHLADIAKNTKVAVSGAP